MKNGIQHYQKVQAQTASKEALLMMLLDAARNHIHHGKKMCAAEDWAKGAQRLHKAVDIVLELRATLKYAEAPELVENLTHVYIFVESHLQLAMLRRTTEHLDEVERVFSPIVDAFREAIQQQEKAA